MQEATKRGRTDGGGGGGEAATIGVVPVVNSSGSVERSAGGVAEWTTAAEGRGETKNTTSDEAAGFAEQLHAKQ